MSGKKYGLMRNARKDGNQDEIRDKLRARGYDVDIVHMLPKFCDLIISGVAAWSDGRAVAVRVEVKMQKKKLSPDEVVYWGKQRHPENLIIAETAADVLAWFGY